jgi:hypothetical protein
VRHGGRRTASNRPLLPRIFIVTGSHPLPEASFKSASKSFRVPRPDIPNQAPFWDGVLFFESPTDMLAKEVIPANPPRFMVSTALEGTITRAPFSFKPSKSMFIARRCRAVGFSM